MRLEHENKMLKLQSSGESSEQSEMLQTMLDDANARKNELETDLRFHFWVFCFVNIWFCIIFVFLLF